VRHVLLVLDVLQGQFLLCALCLKLGIFSSLSLCIER
jgi:hypothetical protein